MKQGLEVPCIAVNASGAQLAGGNFPEMVRAALAESGFPPSKLEIEVTETALVGNLESALKQIAGLRSWEFRFAIDDFGTGYSSLNQLRTLTVDSVKVDGPSSRIWSSCPANRPRWFGGIVGMAHNLGLSVVAEGVETAGQLVILRSLGCDVSQGSFCIGRWPSARWRL